MNSTWEVHTYSILVLELRFRNHAYLLVNFSDSGDSREVRLVTKITIFKVNLRVIVHHTVHNTLIMMMLVGRNTHARIILLALMNILLQIIWSFRMPHVPSNHKYSYCSRIHLNGHGLQMAAYDSTVVHNAPVDYSSLAVDDPLFADMPWPTESGTAESKAFANHIQWKRKLSDGES